MIFIPVSLQTSLLGFRAFRYREARAVTSFPFDLSSATTALINRDRGSRSQREFVASRSRFAKIGNRTVYGNRHATPLDMTNLQKDSTVLIIRSRLAKENTWLKLAATRNNELNFRLCHGNRGLPTIRCKSCRARGRSQGWHTEDTLLPSAGNRVKAITLITTADLAVIEAYCRLHSADVPIDTPLTCVLIILAHAPFGRDALTAHLVRGRTVVEPVALENRILKCSNVRDSVRDNAASE